MLKKEKVEALYRHSSLYRHLSPAASLIHYYQSNSICSLVSHTRAEHCRKEIFGYFSSFPSSLPIRDLLRIESLFAGLPSALHLTFVLIAPISGFQ